MARLLDFGSNKTLDFETPADKFNLCVADRINPPQRADISITFEFDRLYRREERKGLTQLAAELKWVCPHCRGNLDAISRQSLQCQPCNTGYPVVEGIPDLRIHGHNTAWEEQDLATARKYASEAQAASLEATVQQLSDRSHENEFAREMRVRQILGAHSKFLRQFKEWLSPIVSESGSVLDVGCGSGGFLAAAASIQIHAAGIDASMTNLIAAKHMIEAHGGTATLACAYAENLPIESERVSAVTMHDSIEHVSCVESAVSEACRVLKIDGYLAISTPNRFSLTREPHVLVWGVGWLPRQLQAGYVKWRVGQPYDQTRLMSTVEMSGILKRQKGLAFEFRVPPVPTEELEGFPPLRSALAALYNRIHNWGLVRPLMLLVGPFYQVVARRTS